MLDNKPHKLSWQTKILLLISKLMPDVEKAKWPRGFYITNKEFYGIQAERPLINPVQFHPNAISTPRISTRMVMVNSARRAMHQTSLKVARPLALFGFVLILATNGLIAGVSDVGHAIENKWHTMTAKSEVAPVAQDTSTATAPANQLGTKQGNEQERERLIAQSEKLDSDYASGSLDLIHYKNSKTQNITAQVNILKNDFASLFIDASTYNERLTELKAEWNTVSTKK
jgi:hypothetical protein